MRFIKTKMDLIEQSIKRLEKEVEELRRQFENLQYEIQQIEWEEINNNHYGKCFNDQFSESLEALSNLGE